MAVEVDGTKYEEEDLTPEQKYFVAQLRDIEDTINNTKFKLEQSNAAKQVFLVNLRQSLTKVEEPKPVKEVVNA